MTFGMNNNYRQFEDDQVSSTSDEAEIETKVYKRRWYVLALFSAMACHQCAIWNTYGPIDRSVKYAYPNWTDATIAMMANWGTIMFCLFCLPMCWILEKFGLRPAVLLSKLRYVFGRDNRCVQPF